VVPAQQLSLLDLVDRQAITWYVCYCNRQHTQRVELAPNWRRVREWFSFGPITCVEVAKTGLGINSWRVRTPWQLFKYLRERGCVLR
jgi:hypothetical protein